MSELFIQYASTVDGAFYWNFYSRGDHPSSATMGVLKLENSNYYFNKFIFYKGLANVH